MSPRRVKFLLMTAICKLDRSNQKSYVQSLLRRKADGKKYLQFGRGESRQQCFARSVRSRREDGSDAGSAVSDANRKWSFYH